MKLGYDSEIKYDETVGTVNLYLLTLDGEPTMYAVCDTADPEKAIKIRRVGSSQTLLDTKGRFKMTAKLTEDADGVPTGVQERVDSKSVYQYVLPRLIPLLGRLVRAA